MNVTVTMPRTVWDDFLDPLASGMQSELELPAPRHRALGRGGQVIYDDVPIDIARELGDYLRSRAELLLSNSDPEFEARERGMYRRAISVADAIESHIGEERNGHT